jgi:alginate O-acetyltransferase complex protein AlgI
MIFATYWFLALVIIFFPIYWFLNARLRIWAIATASVIFHFHYAGPAGVLPIILLGTLVYFLGRSPYKISYLFGISVCVLTLISYKYLIFFTTSVIGSINPHLGDYAVSATKKVLPLSPPLAISFFTFELIHYLVDRHKGNYAIKNPLEFGLFAIFFPTLVAGPIKRYEEFLPSLHLGLKNINSRDIMHGMIQIALGYTKKIIADNLTLWIQQQQPSFYHLSLGYRWALFAAIGFRILFDFSGYSDIAIGLTRMMGIYIPANFNWPYFSTNILYKLRQMNL